MRSSMTSAYFPRIAAVHRPLSFDYHEACLVALGTMNVSGAPVFTNDPNGALRVLITAAGAREELDGLARCQLPVPPSSGFAPRLRLVLEATREAVLAFGRTMTTVDPVRENRSNAPCFLLCCASC